MLTIYANVINHALMISNAQAGYSAVSLPTGSISVDAVQFTFSGAEWDACSAKYAVFWHDPARIYEVTISNGVAVIPAEALTEPGIVYVAAYGDNGGTRIATNARAFTAEQGALTAETAPAPTPSMFEQAVDTAVDAAVAEILRTIIDATLSISGKAADAAATGSAIYTLNQTEAAHWAQVRQIANVRIPAVNKLIEDATGNSIVSAAHVGYIDVGGAIADIENPVADSGFTYVVLDAVEGDQFTIAGNRGGTRTSFLSFVDRDGRVISRHYTADENTYKTVTAPSEAVHVIVNFDTSKTQYCYVGKLLKTTVAELGTDLGTKTAANMTLDGYVLPRTRPESITEADTILSAIEKLAFRLEQLENALN